MNEAAAERYYLPGQAAAISGVSQVVQRDWRKRGFLANTPGRWTRYTARDVAMLLAMRVLVDRGHRPGAAKTMASKVAPYILAPRHHFAVFYGGNSVVLSDNFLSVVQAATSEPAYSGGLTVLDLPKLNHRLRVAALRRNG